MTPGFAPAFFFSGPPPQWRPLRDAHESGSANGSLDMSLESVNDDANGGNGSDLKVTNGVWAGSRFAIVGAEDLGSGLKGLFNIEHRFSPDTGTVTSCATGVDDTTQLALSVGVGLRQGRTGGRRRYETPEDCPGRSSLPLTPPSISS